MKWIGTDIERDIKQSIMDYLPKYYENSKVVNEITRVDAEELENLYSNISDVLAQCFVETATWGLSIWEKQLGMETNLSESYEIRRAKVLTKMRGANTFGKKEALALAKSFSYVGTKTWFKENNDGSFTTGFEVDDLIDYEKMIESFDEVKPAHLAHMVNLLMSINFAPSLGIKINMKYAIKQVFYIDIIEKMKLNIRNSVFLNSKYDVISINKLTLNGAWALNGEQDLDGVNNKGISLYFNDTLHIKVYQNGNLVEEYKV